MLPAGRTAKSIVSKWLPCPRDRRSSSHGLSARDQREHCRLGSISRHHRGHAWRGRRGTPPYRLFRWTFRRCCHQRSYPSFRAAICLLQSSHQVALRSMWRAHRLARPCWLSSPSHSPSTISDCGLYEIMADSRAQRKQGSPRVLGVLPELWMLLSQEQRVIMRVRCDARVDALHADLVDGGSGDVAPSRPAPQQPTEGLATNSPR